MNEEKGFIGEEQESSAGEAEDKKKGLSSASRARNRTVMLTPEMTGQVRALLHRGPGEGGDEGAAADSDPLENFLPPLTDWDQGGGDNASSGSSTDFGVVEEASEADEGGSTGKFGREDLDQPSDSNLGHNWDGGGFGSVASSSAPVQRVAEPAPAESEQAMGSRSSQPSFSVNRGAVPRGSASGTSRAPRNPMPSGTRAGPVLSSAERTKIIGFLISFDKDSCGEVVEIRAGRWLLTSRPTDHGDYILVNDETISPLHAILRATRDGKIQVLDQLSEFGTGIIRVGSEEEIEIAGGLETVSHGDTVRFGKRFFVVCFVPEVASLGSEEEEAHEE